MRVLVFGGAGQLGGAFVQRARQLAHIVYAPSHEQCDALDAGAVLLCAQRFDPDVVINCVAEVNVPRCERQPYRAFQLNALTAHNIAAAAEAVDADCVYISTGCVFGRNSTLHSMYMVSDKPCPHNLYAVSKLAGEDATREMAPRAYIVRVSTLFGPRVCRGKGYNLAQLIWSKLKTEGRFSVDCLMRFSPTYTNDVVAATFDAILRLPPATYHFTNDGQCSVKEFAQKVKEYAGLDGVIEYADVFDAGRPKSVVLHNGSPIQIRHWKAALHEYVTEYLK